MVLILRKEHKGFLQFCNAVLLRNLGCHDVHEVLEVDRDDAFFLSVDDAALHRDRFPELINLSLDFGLCRFEAERT